MQTKAKSNSIITHSVANGVITWTVLGAGSCSLDTNQISDAVGARAEIHGLIQRVSDRAAIGRDKATGKAASPVDKLLAMKDMCDHYATGTAEWELPRAVSAGSTADAGLLLSAMRRAFPRKFDSKLQFDEFLADNAEASGVSEAVLRGQLLDDPKIKPHADAIRAERKAVAPVVDTTAMLSSLENEPESESEEEEIEENEEENPAE